MQYFGNNSALKMKYIDADITTTMKTIILLLIWIFPCFQEELNYFNVLNIV